jgi:ribosomal protein S18 acetylase RimI-like enzyme
MIKKISKKYLNKIMQIHEKSIYPMWNKQGRKYNPEKLKIYVEKIFDKEGVFGFFIDQKIVGCLGLNIENKKGIIEFILVLPEFQGRGIGSKLMVFTEDYFKKENINKIQLHVLKRNPALNLYKRLGYKISKKRKLKYDMEKIL